MRKHAEFRQVVRLLSLLLCFVLAVAVLVPASVQVQARSEGRTVRVGWFDSHFNTISSSGQRSGYAYDYQQKIAAYTGWKYEYVEGSWTELLDMLERGEIDMLSDVSYTEDRAKKILFPSLPMGTEEYFFFIAPGNKEITPEDLTSFNGKKIGVNKDSVQEGFYRDWAKQHGIKAKLVEVTGSEDESLHMLQIGELDAYITPDVFKDLTKAVPVCKVGSSDFFFAVDKRKPEILSELNDAMSKIQDEDRYFNQKLFEKYLTKSGTNALLSSAEQKWIARHGAIRVGYQDNYLAFCASDPKTGKLTGALKDYLAYASNCIENTQLEFEPVAFSTAEDALKALDMGNVDCVFPTNLSTFDGEEMDVALTPSIMSTDVYAVVRQNEKDFFSDKEHVIVAVNKGNPNYDAFLRDRYPEWTAVYFPDTENCLQAVAEGVADCVLISNYRYNNLAKFCEKHHLTTFDTGIELDYCFAVGHGQVELYGILSRINGMIPTNAINEAMAYYIAEDARFTLKDFIMNNLILILVVIGILILFILALMIQSMRSEKKAKKLIEATELDDMTGLYNRDFFFQYADRIYREHPDSPMNAIVLNIEQFHSVNALEGRDFGDRVLQLLGREIHAISEEAGGIAGRFEADRFDIYCHSIHSYQKVYDQLQGALNNLAPNDSVRLRMGVMPWQEGLEPVQLFDRARTACSMARGNFQERLIVFDESLRQQEVYEQRLLNDLRRALDNYEFEVYYQPKFDIQTDPPKLVSAEALVRWRHSELGMIPPDDFVPLFERNGKIGEVDKYVWSEAGRQIVRWRDQYEVTVPISVNLSRVDVFDPMLENALETVLAFNGLDHTDLKLEVTESAYTENADQVIRVIEGLRQKGYVVEMDDFGSGYSSLNMLSAMPIDVLKMDRAFIQNIESDEKDIQLVGLILDIARSLKIPVVAEGVESESQLKLLKELGCAVVQGYYFSRPLPATEFGDRFLSSMQPDV